VHYDQIGNGGSSHLPGADARFWTPELFLEELDNLLRQLSVADNYVLFGHSWGMLSARHAALRPPGLRGLVVANAPASYPLWRQQMEVLRAGLPAEVDATLRRHEADGTTTAREYLDAAEIFYRRHMCRITWPRDFLASYLEMSSNPAVYFAMNGPTEFHVIGSLRDWSVVDCLPGIAVPFLLGTHGVPRGMPSGRLGSRGVRARSYEGPGRGTSGFPSASSVILPGRRVSPSRTRRLKGR
jgi:L-proline amide hydrolase